MAIDKTQLEQVFAEMKDLFLEDPDKAVKSQGFIRKLHNYCIYELKRLGIKENKVTIKDEFLKVAKVAAVGIIILGFIGFAISLMMKIFVK